MSQPTPQEQEVERAREWMEKQRNTGIFSSQHEDAYDLLAAYHAHASAEEAEKVRRLVEAATAYVNSGFLEISHECKNAELRSALDALKERK